MAEEGWPWMKGIDAPIAEPIDPVVEEDVRPAVLDLIAEKRKLIDDVRAELKDDPLFSSTKHDDLWILRFVLSHKKVKPAVKAAKHTLNFRREHKLDETDIREVDIATVKKGSDGKAKYYNCCGDDAFLFTIPDPKRGVIIFIHYAAVRQHKILKEVSEDEWFEPFLFISEFTFQWVDYITRTTGRLTKTVRFCDLVGHKISDNNREAIRRDGKAMGVMEDCYPQMLQSLFVCNPPVWLEITWAIFRPIMPKRVVEKVDILSPKKKVKHRQRFYAHISEEKLPERYGGKRTGWPVPPRG